MYLKYHYQPPGNGDQIGNQYNKSKFNHHFALSIVEQDDDELFNQALLPNTGLGHVAPKFECFIQHNVNLVPAFYSPIPYHNCQMLANLAACTKPKNFYLQHDTWFSSIL
ncbi:hypothetical protein ACA910_005929 [Epithemia clementina (nom. ined.)]